MSVPRHKIFYDVDPESNMLCSKYSRYGKPLEKDKKECFAIDAKNKDGQYIFLEYGGYFCGSSQAIKEILHGMETAK